MIPPTPGRVVWYHPPINEARAGFAPPALPGVPLAALVARVWSDTCVNLLVIDANGMPHSRTSVLLVQDGMTKPDGDFAEWMPYQKGQAAKADAAKRDVGGARADDTTIERESRAKGLNAPRVTQDEFEANVKRVEFVKHTSAGGQVLRWAVITTASGFAVTGRPSVAVSPENDDTEIGEKLALDNAKNELWPLMGYSLKEQLFQRTQPAQAPD